MLTCWLIAVPILLKLPYVGLMLPGSWESSAPTLVGAAHS